MRLALIGGALALAAIAGTALAQDPPPAPTAGTEPVLRIRASVSAGGRDQWPAPAARMIRRAAAMGNPSVWIQKGDAPFTTWLKVGDSATVTLELRVGADGRATACKPAPQPWERPPAWVDDLCPPLLERARFIPALRDDGTLMDDTVTFSASFRHSAPAGPPGRAPDYKFSRSYGPPPCIDCDNPLRSWPPSASWLAVSAREPVFRQPVERPGGEALTGPTIGLVVADPKSSNPLCSVKRSSGNAGLDARACEFAVTRLTPQWADTVRFPIRQWPLLLSPKGKGFRVITADPSAVREQRIEPAEVKRLTALWHPYAEGARAVWVAGSLGPTGRATECRVITSSGSDAADAAACRLFRYEARFPVTRDVFGQPGRRSGWVTLRLTPP